MPSITKQTKTGNVFSTNPVKRIRSIFDEREPETWKINVYGQSGTGKTRFWSTFPKPILCLLFSSRGEVRSAKSKKNEGKIDAIQVQSTQEIKELCEFVKTSGVYKTVAVDHVTGLQEMTLKEILGLEELPPQLSWGLATQQQYGQCTLKCKEFLRNLINLPTNVCLVAHERDFNEGDTDPELSIPFVASALSPSLVSWLNGQCDAIVQTFKRAETVEVKTKVGTKEVSTKKKTGKIQYCMRVGPHERYMTGIRLPEGQELPDVIVNSSYDKIVSLLD